MNDSSPGFRRMRPTWSGLLATLLLVILLAAPLPLAAQPATSSTIALDAIKPEQRDEVAALLPDGLPVYDLTLTFPAAGSLTLRGTSTLTYTNTTGEDLTALPFRLYANGPDAGHDALTIEHVTVDGAGATPEWSVDNSVATVPLPSPLAPDAETTIAMGFAAEVPLDAREHYGIFNLSSSTGTWALAHWYPVLAGRDPVTGWMLEPTSKNGDPIFSDTAAYDVTVIAPDDLQLITSGVQTATEPRENGMQATIFSAAPSRDFTIVADSDMRSVTREVAGTTITSWYEPGRDVSGEAVALWAEQSLEVFNDLLGEYPYRELQLVQVEIYGAAGVEFPQLIYMGSTYYDRETLPDGPSSFEFTVAHEVVHQWFYNLVGNNQYAHAFIDEGLTNYLSAQVYFERVYDAAAAARVSDSYLEGPFERAVASDSDEIVDTPTDAFSSSRGYVMAAYSKAPMGFAAIRETVGDEAFFAALRAYVHAFCFRVATPDDLRTAFDAASDQDVDSVWTHWFEERNGTDDVTPEN